MSRTSSLTEVKLPARITSPVRSAKKRSTRLSQDEEVGVKCILKRGCLASPRLHLRVLVGGVVVGDEMQVEAARRLPVDLLEEAQPFDVSVARLGARDQLARHLLEGGKQSDCAVPDVVVRHRAQTLGRQRQAELRAFESLALAFLVAAQHQSLVGRVEIEADHVPELFLELRIVRQLEGLQTVRLD